MRRAMLSFAVLMAASCGDDTMPTTPSGASLSFFVTSATSTTGNLGGLAGADATCQRLAAAVGQGSRTWRAYLSIERDPANGNQPIHARDRIGTGPWFNANRWPSPTLSPNFTPAPVTPVCSLTNAGSGSTGSGQAPRRRLNTTS
jgi:hypothetical protein